MSRRLSDRRVLVLSGAGRIGIGTALVARPSALPKAMGVDTGTARQVGWVGAMVGARDIALGAGLIHAVRRRGDVRPWLLAAAFSDAVDSVAFGTAVAKRGASPVVGTFGAAMALAVAAAEAKALRELT